MPWPGEEMVFRVSNQTDRRTFLESGERSVRDLEVMLALAGAKLTDFKRILDFGCGCSRMLLWMEDIGRHSELFGVDIDERMIEWGQENVPWATLSVNQPLPPMDFPDGQFDLVYSASVFTHIDEDYQDRWLTELRRITKPGSKLLLTVHGEHVMELFENAETDAGYDLDISGVRRRLNEDGICFLENDIFVGGPFPEFYHSTFHAPWYIFEHWGQFFSVLAYVSRASVGFQDYVLLERRPDDVELNPIRAKSGSAAQAQTAVPDTQAPAPAPNQLFGRSKDDYKRYLERALRRIARKLLGPPETPQPGQQQIAGGLPVTILIDRLGERLNRLEGDIFKELRSLSERVERLERSGTDNQGTEQ